MSERVRVILNGDDFGYSPGVSRGINKSINDGILTSTSVVVGSVEQRGAEQEVRELCKRVEGRNVSVGIHLEMTKEGIKRWLGILQMFTWSPEKAEEAFLSQIAKFESITGQLPHHIDSHHGVHMHPKIKPVVMKFAKENDIPVRSYSGVRFEMGFYGRSLRHWNDPDNVTDKKLISVLENLPPGDHEIMCHPGYVDDGLKATNTTYLEQREAEVRALTSKSVKEFVDDDDTVALISWKDI